MPDDLVTRLERRASLSTESLASLLGEAAEEVRGGRDPDVAMGALIMTQGAAWVLDWLAGAAWADVIPGTAGERSTPESRAVAGELHGLLTAARDLARRHERLTGEDEFRAALTRED